MSMLKNMLNDQFFTKVASKEHHEKMAAGASTFIKRRVKAKSFFDDIIPPQDITLQELERDIRNKTLHAVEDVEPGSFAAVGAPTGRRERAVVDSDLCGVPITQFKTPLFTYNRRDLDIHKKPVMKYFEENLVKDLGDQKDLFGVVLLETALALNPSHVMSSGAAFSKNLVLSGKHLLKDPDGSRVYPKARFLMNTETYDNFAALDTSQLGDELAKKVLTEKLDFETLLQMKFILTPKSDIIPDGVIYYIAPSDGEENYLGVHYNYRDIEFVGDTKLNDTFQFMGRSESMIGIINGHGVAKLIMT